MKPVQLHDEIELCREIVVRLAGLPVDVLKEIDSPATIALTEQYLERKHQLHSLSTLICDELYEWVPNLTDKKTRQAVIRLKRQIYKHENLKLNDVDLVIPAVSHSLGERIKMFIDSLQECRRLQSDAENSFNIERKAIIQRILHIVKEYPDWSKGIVIASESLGKRLVEVMDDIERLFSYSLLLMIRLYNIRQILSEGRF